MDSSSRNPNADSETRIEESLSVRCSFERGLLHLANFFHRYERVGATAKMDLDVSATIGDLERPLQMRRCAIVTLAPAPASRTNDACYRVYWEPAVPGPYPLFVGELYRAPNGTRTSLSLRLRGVYTPPLALGSGHDVIGKHLALATAQKFLCEVRDFMERDVRTKRMRTDVTSRVAAPSETIAIAMGATQ